MTKVRDGRWRAYLNYAATALLPSAAATAMKRVVRHQEQVGSLAKAEFEAALAEVRAMLAELIHATPEEIALTPNTTSGLQIALSAIPWKKGDEIIIATQSFPANYCVWLPLESRVPNATSSFPTQTGVRLRTAQSQYGPALLDEVYALISRKTRAIALDWVHFFTGYRMPLDDLARLCRRKGIYLVIDGMQGLGALAFDMRRTPVAFLAAGGAKWLCSPWATGFVYISRDILPTLQPAHRGWLSHAWESFERLFPPPPLRAGACAFEGGTFNYAGFYGMRESLKFLLTTPEAEREKETLSRAIRVRDSARRLGYAVLSDYPDADTSGIVSVRPRTGHAQALFRRLTADGVACSFREGYIRLSPHFFTPWSHIDRAMKVLSEP